ncbi:MAG TPA: prepilin-type N-terminal cleavage/methylation domain-containing protein [Gemmatimonadales bacterium]|jgi:prepilin-type N-terminal cleavage/methylation domain-containing protein|nr:prepilin-type N-terminal cleavage/methylation domain-containing protein [Gemmatimonadales bacterium]
MLNRKGFTLIELIVVVVIIGLLATIAVPKLASSKDRARLASVKTDLRNLMTAQEAFYSDNSTYAADYAALQAGTNNTLSSGNAATVVGDASGFTATVSNSTITSGVSQCTVQVGAGAASTADGVITCS